MRILVSLGGNALTREDQRGTWDEQCANARAIAGALADLFTTGHSVIITHGNGPQVGSLAVQQACGSEEVPPLPLDALVAMTQGELGYLIQQSISEVAPLVPTVVVITRVRVDAADPRLSIRSSRSVPTTRNQRPGTGPIATGGSWGQMRVAAGAAWWQVPRPWRSLRQLRSVR